jgi:uncharacterized protein
VTTGRPRPVMSPDDEWFWAHANRHELRLQRCVSCGRYRYPPAPCCPECLGDRAEWTAVSGHGQLLTWTRFHRTYFLGLPAPYVVVVVELDEGPLMVGNTHDELLDPRSGTRMRVVFEEHEVEGGGSVSLPQWEPCPQS